jgi:phospholipid/cholesterol/gamma-HCH transport system substrate-binding protein
VNRRRESTLFSPVVIGALTVLITIVAVVLAFQANTGLPFVPRYTLYVKVANAEELTHGAEVHMGGSLVGSVASISAERRPGGQPYALLDLQLNKSVEPLPVDSRFTIRLKAAIGEKYLDVALGHSHRTWANGATVPMAQTGAEVDLDQVLSMFTPATRKGVAGSTSGFSNAVAGRGIDINDAIGEFKPLVTALGPVMRNLSSPSTNLGGFLKALGSLNGALVPVATEQGSLYVNLDATFRSLATVAVPFLQNWISEQPPTYQTVIDDSPQIQPFLTDTAALFTDLRPGFATLHTSAPILADAFAAGAKNLPGTASLDQRTISLSKTLENYGANPTVQGGLDRLTLTAYDLISPLSFLTPAQSTCNYVTLFLRNIASSLSDNIGTGTVLRVVIVAIDDIAGSEATPSSTPFLTPGTAGGSNHGPLHVDPYPNTDAPGQTPECSAGNEPYSANAPVIGNPTQNVGLNTEKTTRSGS